MNPNPLIDSKTVSRMRRSKGVPRGSKRGSLKI